MKSPSYYFWRLVYGISDWLGQKCFGKEHYGNRISFFKNMKWFFQRGRRGYSDCDTWSLDSYLISWLPEAIRTLAKRNFGYPPELDLKSWQEILEKIASGFQSWRELDDLPFDQHLKEFPSRNARFEESITLFAKYFRYLWD